MITGKLCKRCCRYHTPADQVRKVWGFQRWNGHPDIPTLAYYDCECATTFCLELPNPIIREVPVEQFA